MLFRVGWTITGANRNEVTRRFLTAGDDPNYDLPDGLTMKGRWHNPVDLRGTAILETDDEKLLYQYLMNWNDVCDIEVDVVVEDEDCGALCAEMMRRIEA